MESVHHVAVERSRGRRQPEEARRHTPRALRVLLRGAGVTVSPVSQLHRPCRSAANPSWVALALATALAFAAFACAAPRPHPSAADRPSAAVIGPTALPAMWRYEVAFDPGARALLVDMVVPEGPPQPLTVDDGAEGFVRDAVLLAGPRVSPLPARQLIWLTPPCPAAGCHIRYRFLLADAAEALDDPLYAARYGGAFVSPPSVWLLHPIDDSDAERRPPPRFRLTVTMPDGLAFATGLFPSPSEPSTFEASLADLQIGPYSAFGAFRVRELATDEARLKLAVLPGELDAGDDALIGWVERAAQSVTRYYGRFPVPHALILVAPGGRGGMRGASALGHGGASIHARIGRRTTEDDMAQDWQMTHEMVHLAFPNVGRRHAWLEEGLATYVEPIARARTGIIPAEEVWRGLALGLPKGLPMAGDRGLDNTPTWGRIYWGGALFCLLADLEIRERTSNQRALDDALRGILAAGGDITARWPIERVLAEADRVTGVPVLAQLYASMKDRAVDVDLPALWARLGVRFDGGRVVLDESAPLAAIRDAITGEANLARR